ncbi:MAG: hypothetical protein MR750_02285 [Methanobrevibacter boviskoreani]|uniref:hypothetical protein n=1 Tax=Methanobrevibacter TaxID=2172 RepID=UPI00033481F1|nr:MULTISPECIES: hypothetical protein [Methanobrevibacter]AGN16453.1 hypothetical protein Abm4_0554 [Methanobrevibacter sp. AbM4]MCI6930072.1 hypothetical protein [Methanobrevibacter boviskoreani]MDY5614840.1 hypothetical protein [Methanobrevibacter boviskoreani]
MSDYWDEICEHREALIFLGGIATAYIGKKILESQQVKKACTQGMASVMAVKRDAEECYQDMKENAEDIVVDSSKAEKKQIYADSKKE